MAPGFMTKTMKKYSCRQGSHVFSPSVSLNIDLGEKLWGWLIQFDESCIYDHHDDDQYDFNKVGGVSFRLLDNLDISSLFGWRWNIEKGVMEINVYNHISGRRDIGPVGMNLSVGEKAYLWLEIDFSLGNVTHRMMKEETVYSLTTAFPKIPKFNREIGAWFGGNKTAPHDMVIYKEKIWAWEKKDGMWMPNRKVHY